MSFRLGHYLGVVAFLAASLASAQDFVPGEVIVKFKKNANRERLDVNRMYEDIGVRKVARFSRKTEARHFEHLILKSNVKVEDALASLRSSDLVEYAEPNYIVTIPKVKRGRGVRNPEAQGLEGETAFGEEGSDCFNCEGDLMADLSLTALGRPPVKDIPKDVDPPVADPDMEKTYGINKVQAPAVWQSAGRGDKKIVVAVIDTGVDYNHEDLSFNMWRNPSPTKGDLVGYDFIHDDGLPFDDHSHGTHVSGTVGGVGGNGIGVSGVSQRVSIMALKFLSSGGSGSIEGAIRAIDYATEKKAKIMSNSWGCAGSSCGSKALEEAITRSKEQGVLFVVAAGNNAVDNDTSPSKNFPASFRVDNIVSVAATDSADGKANFSAYGKESVHLGAPGVSVHSSVPGNRYASFSGTSMACPHVAGAAALLWHKNPNWTYKQIKDALVRGADPVGSLAGKTVSGGRMNVAKSMQLLSRRMRTRR